MAAGIKISGSPYPFALTVGTPNGTEVFAADQTVSGILGTVSVSVAELFGGGSIAYSSGLSITGSAASNYNLTMAAVSGHTANFTVAGNGNGTSSGVLLQQDNTSTGYFRNLGGSLNIGAGSQNALNINTSGNVTANLPSSGGALLIETNVTAFGGFGEGLTVNAQASGQACGISFSTNNIGRWTWGKNQAAESGSNVGSDLGLYAFSDTGSYLGNPITVQRSTGASFFGAYGSTITITAYGVSGNATAYMLGYNGTGVSDGLLIQSGTNASDYALAVSNRANSSQFMKLYGDGSGQLGPNTTNTLSWNASGNYSISAPSSGSSLGLTAVSGANFSELHYLNSSAYTTGAWNTVAGIGINNTSSTMQSTIDFAKSGTLSGRIRNDYVGNMNYICTGSGVHNFFIGGDSGVGTSPFAIVSTGASINGVPVATNNSGSFTGTLTGMTGTVTGTVYYCIVGEVCTLQASFNGTSNSTTMTLTGVPAACQPPFVSSIIPCNLENNGANVLGCAYVVAASGTISLYPGVYASTFTASGTKGLNVWTITYLLR